MATAVINSKMMCIPGQFASWLKLWRLASAVLVCLIGIAGWGCTQQGSQPNPAPASQAKSVAPRQPEPKTPLETANELHRRGLGGAKLYAALEQARDVLPTCTCTSGEMAPDWNGLRLNRTGAGLDAIRVRSELTAPANLLFALATTYDSAVQEVFVIGPDGAVRRAQDAYTRLDLDLGADGLSGRNLVVFRRVGGGQIQPGANYYVCFQLSGWRPVDVQLKLKLVANEPPLESVTIHELARALNFELPFRFSAAARVLDRARDTLEFSGREDALRVLDEANAQGTSSRQTDYFKALITHEAAYRLVSAQDRDAADPVFLEAAQMFRAAGRAHGHYTPDEQKSFGSAFYDEACVYARRGEKDQAIKSLHAAILFGFTKIHYMQEDEDLAILRETPEFQKLVAEFLNETP